MTELVVKTRIKPRKLSGNIIHRSALIDKLKKEKSKNLILITAPAGFGKTTLVQDFLQNSELKYAWLQAAEDIDSFYSFINYITYSLSEVIPGFGENTLNIATALKDNGLIINEVKNSVSTITGTFLNDFVQSVHDDIYLVIDDYQNFGEKEWLRIFFNSITDQIPENLHILISSRSIPDFNISRYSAKRNLIQVDVKDLAFSTDESRMLLENLYDIYLKNEDIEMLDSKIEGWITGIHLTAQAYGKDLMKYITSSKNIDEHIFNYFADDIFDNLTVKYQDFLLNTSLPESFTSELCDEIFEPNSINTINELVNKNIFIESYLSDGTYIYNYYKLFRDFLISRLFKVKSPEELIKLYRKYAEYFRAKKDNIRAVEFMIMQNNYKEACGLINSIYDELAEKGNYSLLDKWISKIPDDIIKIESLLLFNKANLLQYYKNDIDSAYNIISVLNDSVVNNELSVKIKIELSQLLRAKGNKKEAAEILEALYISNTSAHQKANIIHILAIVYYDMGSKKYDRIIDLLNEGIEICNEINEKKLKIGMFNIFGRIFQNRGDFIKALYYFENAAHQENNVYKKFITYTDIVLLLSWSGDYSKAYDYLNQAYGLFKNYPSPSFEKILLRVTGHFKFESGDYEDAIANFNKLDIIYRGLNINAYSIWIHLLISECYTFLKQKSKAEEHLQLAKESMDGNDEYQKLEYDIHRAVISNKFTPDIKNEKVFNKASKFFKSDDLVYSKAQIDFYLAELYYKTGTPSTALKYMTDSITVSSEKQYLSYLIQHYNSSAYLFDMLLTSDIKADFIINIRDKALEKIEYKWLSAAAHKRIIDEHFGLFDIHAKTLGCSDIYVRGKLIGEDLWTRKKSKLILIYLLVNINKKFTKDKMLELFFSELKPESAENIFHQAITNIRSNAKPAQPYNVKLKDEYNANFIIYEDKLLKLNHKYLYKTDAVEFDELSRQVVSSERSDAEKVVFAKKAIDLYNGDFLPGYYDDWIEDMRSIFQNKLIEICEIMIELFKKKKKYDEIIFYAEKLIAVDNLHEEAYTDLIEAYSHSGNQNLAKKRFSELLKNFKEEYNEKPSRDLLTRIDQVLS